MKTVKTWEERFKETPETGGWLSADAIRQQHMQAEIFELRKAIAHKEAQTVEPVGEFHDIDDGIGTVVFELYNPVDRIAGVKLFTHPAPPAAKQPLPAEREALIVDLGLAASHLSRYDLPGLPMNPFAAVCHRAADMLNADVQTCNCRFVGDVNTQQCTLHNAWAETLTEQAGYRKDRDTLLAEKAQQVAVLKDAVTYGVGVSLGGVRINPKDMYLKPEQQVAVPQEWQLVPIVPTPKMLDSTWHHPQDSNPGIESQTARNERIYRVMLDAAPQPPQGE